MRSLTLFYSYSHRDEELRDELEKHLAMLRRQGVIEEWHDRRIAAGDEWDGEINQHLGRADIVLFLVSSDFLASDYCYDVEVAQAMKRHKAGEARVIPVFLRDCDWKGAPFGKLQGVPTDARPVTSWANRDEAFTDVAKAVRRAAEAMQEKPAAAPAWGQIWNLPAPTRTFTGRSEQLADVEQTLTEGERMALTALHGLGGVGKTQIVLEFARRHRDDYAIGWLIRAEEPGVLTGDLSELAVRLGIAPRDAGPEATLAALRSWWAAHDRWLLVYDNAESAEAVRNALPKAGRGHVLITSRAAAWRGVAEPVPVRVMGRAEAAGFLIRRAGRTKADRPAAERLAEELGDLPLALEQAAAYAEETGLSFDDYLGLFRQRRANLLAERSATADYPESVATTWSLAFERVEAEEPAAAALLKLCACLAPDDIPGRRIRDWDQPWPVPLDAVQTDPLAWGQALQALRRHSLVRPDGDGLSVHRLVQAVTLDRMDGKDRQTWVGVALRFMCGVLNVSYPEMSGRMAEFSALAPHAYSVLGIQQEEEATHVDLLRGVATFAQLRADYDGAQSLLQRSINLAEKIHGPDSAAVAELVNNSGSVLHDRGDLEGAEAAYRRALAIDESVPGDNGAAVVRDLNNLGLLLYERGELDSAGKILQRNLVLRKSIYSPDHIEVTTAMNNLGLVLCGRGNLVGAEALHRRALALDEVTLGLDHPVIATDLVNLSRVLLEQGDTDGAEASVRRAIAIDEITYGPDHPEVAIDLISLGLVLQAQGDSGAAEATLSRALAVFERKGGSDHPRTEEVRSRLADLRR
jgi:tetratricopeptide (TPR) repeat protein